MHINTFLYMKTKIFYLAFLFIFCLKSHSQGADTYSFSQTSSTYLALTGTTLTTAGGPGWTTENDRVCNAISLGFTFNFAGVSYTDIQVSSNGWLALGGLLSSNNGSSGQIASAATNSQANAATPKPILFPLWDDLQNRVAPRYVTTGSAPNRIFKMEWLNQEWSSSANAAVISFQVWLYETTNVIEYRYSQGAAAVSSGSASIGIYDSNDKYLTLNNSTSGAAASSTVFTTTINAKPANGQVFRFTPCNPSSFGVTGTSQFLCGNDLPVATNIGISNSQTGVNYQVYNGAIPIGSAVPGTGAAIPLIASVSNVGFYKVIGTSGSCSNTMSGGVTISQYEKPNVPTPSTAACGELTMTNIFNPSSLKFDRTGNNRVNIGQTLLNNLTQFSLEGWIKLDQNPPVCSSRSILGQAGVVEFGILCDGLNQQLLYCILPAISDFNSNPQSLKQISFRLTNIASFDFSQWHHVALTGDTTENLRLYVDGVIRATTPVGGIANVGSFTTNAAIGNNVFRTTNGNDSGLGGEILKVGFWNRVLTPTEIAALAGGFIKYNANLSGLLASYNFNDGTSSANLASVGSVAGATGTLAGSPLPVWTDPNTYTWLLGGLPFTPTVTSTTAANSAFSGFPDGSYTVTAALKNCVTNPASDFTVSIGQSTPPVPVLITGGAGCPFPTGSVTVTNTVPPNTTYTYSFNGGAYQSNNFLTGIAAGATVNVRIRRSFGMPELVCISDPPVSTTVGTVTTTTWSGSPGGWSIPPTNAMRGVISSNANLTTNVDLCSCTVDTGVNVVVGNASTAPTLNLKGFLAVNGTMTFENNASLVQENPSVTNTGNITYKRTTQPVRRFDYTYWSTPVADTRNLSVIFPGTLSDKYLDFNPVTNDWNYLPPATSTMTVGRGYAIRAPQANSISAATTVPYSFVGVPNNGNITLSAALIGAAPNYNLVGNPYPSAISATKFIEANGPAPGTGVLGGTLYFWTHNTARTSSAPPYSYTTDDYASYNLTGGVGTGTAAVSGGSAPTGNIAAGQSFFVEGGTVAGSVTFNNAMRVSGNNNQFYRTSKKVASDKSRIWLNLSNENGLFKQLLVGYIEGATNNWDALYDGESFDGNEYADFYSINSDKNMVIQGRAAPFSETDAVPLGYKSTLAEPVEITIDSTDGLLEGQAVYLEDKKENVVHDLRQGSYQFLPIIGEEKDRFVLKYSNENALGTNTNEIASSAVLIYAQDKDIVVDANDAKINGIEVYDLLGRQLYTQKTTQNKFVISNLKQSNQVLIVKAQLENGKIKTDKIVF
jgi:Concanavalin A-like lectin/glucanases superfamily